MSALLYRIGRSSSRHPWRVLAAWVLLAIAAFMINTSIGGEPSESFRLPGSESQKAADALEDRFPHETVITSNIIFHAEEGLTSPEAKAAIGEAVKALETGPNVAAVSDPYDPRGPTLSKDGDTAFTTVAFKSDEVGIEQFEAAEKATEVARDAGVQVEYDGGLGYAKGDAEPGSEKVGILVAIIVLAVAFGSLVAMSLPIIVALVAILIGMSTIGIASGFMDVPDITTIVGIMLGLGVGIDYALFILARHRQHLEEGMPVQEAVGRANATAGLSVLFAGITVIVAIAGLQVSGVPMLTMMGWGSALMVAVVMFAALTLLPALLGIVGTKVNALRVPFIKPKPAYNPRSKSSRWAAKVVARPVGYGLVAAIVLGVLAAPVFALRLGFPDAGNDGASTTTRKAYDLLADGYGDGVNGPVQVVIELNGENGKAAVATVAAALAADKGIASVDEPAVSPDGEIAVIGATPTTSPQDAKTDALVDRLRDELPKAVSEGNANVMVTGGTAMMNDLSNRLQQRMLWFMGAVLGLSFLVLLLVFRSVLVPLKAVALNLLSIGAAYGVLVAVFQWGWGASLIGVHETVPIMPLAPMLMFAILFGLSMDYEVFLLSRVREQFLKHRNPKKAIVEGVGSTARVITSAALIMISVFAAFVLSSDVTTKLFGVGLAVAVLLDVTLVRMVLVPAAMSLLGHRAWWLPKSLDRVLPSIDLEGGAHVEEQIVLDDEPVVDGDHDDEREPALV